MKQSSSLCCLFVSAPLRKYGDAVGALRKHVECINYYQSLRGFVSKCLTCRLSRQFFVVGRRGGFLVNREAISRQVDFLVGDVGLRNRATSKYPFLHSYASERVGGRASVTPSRKGTQDFHTHVGRHPRLQQPFASPHSLRAVSCGRPIAVLPNMSLEPCFLRCLLAGKCSKGQQCPFLHSRYKADEEHRRKIQADRPAKRTKSPRLAAASSNSVPRSNRPDAAINADHFPLGTGRDAHGVAVSSGEGKGDDSKTSDAADEDLEVPWDPPNDVDGVYFYGTPGGFDDGRTPRSREGAARASPTTSGSWRDVLTSECGQPLEYCTMENCCQFFYMRTVCRQMPANIWGQLAMMAQIQFMTAAVTQNECKLKKRCFWRVTPRCMQHYMYIYIYNTV